MNNGSKQENAKPELFDEKLPFCHKGLTSILTSLIQINPFFRKSANECLRESIFDDIRDRTLERSPHVKVMLEIDQDDAFDYKNCVSLKYQLKDCIAMIDKEVQEVRAQRLKQIKTLYR